MNTAPKDSASPTAPRASRAADSSKVPYDAQLGSPFRGYFLWPLTFLWAVSFAMLIPVAALVAPQWFKKHGWCLPRTWGRVPLWWHGVKVDVTGEENLEFEGPRLLLFNHVSLLDLLIMAAHCPENSIVIHKKELLKIPGLGIGLKSLGMIAIDRKDTKSAIASMNSAAERIRENGESVIMAPEGTRSRKGGLQRFKKGTVPFGDTNWGATRAVPNEGCRSSSTNGLHSYPSRPNRHRHFAADFVRRVGAQRHG